MTALVVAVIAGLATVGSAAIALLASRGPLHRLDVVSRALDGMAEDDPARATLVEVRRLDSLDIARSQGSILKYLAGLWLLVSVLAIAVSIFGQEIVAWSPQAYDVLVLLELIVVVAFAVLLVTGAAGLFVGSVRWFRKRAGHNRRGGRRT